MLLQVNASRQEVDTHTAVRSGSCRVNTPHCLKPTATKQAELLKARQIGGANLRAGLALAETSHAKCHHPPLAAAQFPAHPMRSLHNTLEMPSTPELAFNTTIPLLLRFPPLCYCRCTRSESVRAGVAAVCVALAGDCVGWVVVAVHASEQAVHRACGCTHGDALQSLLEQLGHLLRAVKHKLGVSEHVSGGLLELLGGQGHAASLLVSAEDHHLWAGKGVGGWVRGLVVRWICMYIRVLKGTLLQLNAYQTKPMRRLATIRPNARKPRGTNEINKDKKGTTELIQKRSKTPLILTCLISMKDVCAKLNHKSYILHA